MGMEGFFVGAALLVAVFWLIGKLFIKAVKFVMVAAIGVAVVAAVCAARSLYVIVYFRYSMLGPRLAAMSCLCIMSP